MGVNRDRVRNYRPTPSNQLTQHDVFSESNVKAAFRRALEARDASNVQPKPLPKPTNNLNEDPVFNDRNIRATIKRAFAARDA